MQKLYILIPRLMGLSRNYHFRRPVMSLQLAVFATVRGIVQKTLVAHVNHQDPSAPLFVIGKRR